MDRIDTARESLLAAPTAGDAVAELLRFHMEGPAGDLPFGDADAVAKLAEALLRACRIESAGLVGFPSEQSYRDMLDQLTGTCARFLGEFSGAPEPILLAPSMREKGETA